MTTKTGKSIDIATINAITKAAIGESSVTLTSDGTMPERRASAWLASEFTGRNSVGTILLDRVYGFRVSSGWNAKWYYTKASIVSSAKRFLDADIGTPNEELRRALYEGFRAIL